jgi:Endodeoxyribonuclease RusA.
VTWGKRGVSAYLPDAVAQFYSDLRWAIKAAGVRRPVEGNVRLELRLWRRTKGARGDLSNMVKAFEDAANGVLWVDDRQVVSLAADLEAWGPAVEGRIWARVTPAAGSQA